MLDFTPPKDRKEETLVISKRNIVVGGHIYQMSNICQFGPGVLSKRIIPWTVCLFCGIFGIVAFFSVLTLASLSSDPYDSSGGFGPTSVFFILLSMLFMAAAAAGTWLNLTKGKQYGLLISMSSGEKRLFPTGDSRGIEAASRALLQIWNTVENDLVSQVTVNDHRVTVTAEKISGGAFSTGTINLTDSKDPARNGNE